MVNRGDVWWYEPPENKRRPALVVTRQKAIENLSEVFVVPATTTIRDLATEVELGPEDGMPRNCVLNADHTKTVEKVFFTKRITRLGPIKMAQVCRALALAHGC
ncbi:MAG TPA: type II toxin-antitoxin system PemK/MazF family toxin [Solirubrobacteraceae bacterium]|jgi:mRNA interferase MazF|nr:type II toxin-antitoxin system PemK/MazF family toxin [Solirubrobacteraceae bacterium]